MVSAHTAISSTGSPSPHSTTGSPSFGGILHIRHVDGRSCPWRPGRRARRVSPLTSTGVPECKRCADSHRHSPPRRSPGASDAPRSNRRRSRPALPCREILDGDHVRAQRHHRPQRHSPRRSSPRRAKRRTTPAPASPSRPANPGSREGPPSWRMLRSPGSERVAVSNSANCSAVVGQLGRIGGREMGEEVAGLLHAGQRAQRRVRRQKRRALESQADSCRCRA